MRMMQRWCGKKTLRQSDNRAARVTSYSKTDLVSHYMHTFFLSMIEYKSNMDTLRIRQSIILGALSQSKSSSRTQQENPTLKKLRDKMFHCPLSVWINKIINKYQKWAGDVIYFLLTMKAHLLISSTHSWNVTYNIYTGTSSTWFSCWVHCQASLIRKKTLPTLWTPTKPHINLMIKQVSLQAAGQTKTNTGGFSALRRMSPLTAVCT